MSLAGLDRGVDLPLELVHQVGAGHGADGVGGIGRIADLQVGDRGGEPASELVGDGAVDDEADVLSAVDRDGHGEGLP
jgi:hypothetical protein